jgi:hypothetical protein
MIFPEVAPSRAESQRQITEALRSTSMRLYVDASVLIHCYEISRSACEELLNALEGFGDAVRVPVWSAKETWDHTRGLPSKRPLARTVGGLNKRLQDFRAESLRYVDERTFDDMSLEQYVADVDAAVASLEQLARRAEGIEPGHDDANARLLPFIASHSLTSDLTSIYDEVQRTGETRFSHEVPPGFGDGGTKANGNAESEPEEATNQQKGKKRNRYGDLIMWLEALADVKHAGSQHLVILTRDNSKRDWVYKPDRVLGDDGRLQQNAGLVTLPLPLLVQEAKQRCPALLSVHVISLEMLVTVLRAGFSARVSNLARALQAANRPPRTSQRHERATEPPPGPGPLASDVTFSSQDMIYEPDREEKLEPIWQHIDGLRAEGWSAQNTASSELLDLVPAASPNELKQIGRGVVAASSEEAVGPVDLAQLVLDNPELSASTRANFLVGMLAETYFDENGEAKKPAAHPDIAAALFKAADDPTTHRAFEVTVDEPLGPIRKLYLALPGEPGREINLQLQLAGQVLRGLQANDVDLVEPNAPENRRIAPGGGSVEMPISELVAHIAREFVVPASMLKIEGPTNYQITIPERMGFISWGPTTAEQLR